jgi:hypothetical protein
MMLTALLISHRVDSIRPVSAALSQRRRPLLLDRADFSLRPGTKTYAKTERNFGDPGEQIVDLGHNRRYEFLTAEDSFAGTFTDYAASGLPVQILTGGKKFVANLQRFLRVHAYLR